MSYRTVAPINPKYVQYEKKPRSQYKKKTFSLSKKQIENIAIRAVERTAEHKESDVIALPGTLSSGVVGSVSLLNGIPEGTDNMSRIGRDVKNMYIQFSVLVTNPFATLQQFDMGQCSLIYDRQPNGSLPSYGQIYDTGSALAGNAFRNTSVTPDRFIVLRNWKWQLDGAGQNSFNMSVYVNLKNQMKGRDMSTKYGGTDNTIASINTGAIYFTYGSMYATPTPLAVASQVSFNSRVRFVDI